ncbi:MAG TPA: TauD/TfdA family dioxygenase [Burkholderiales bacterium]|nr:TauD/TfdA family dioxygenase [Burkholderiales bacterium]
MPLTIYPVTENFAAEIGDVDLCTPLSAEQFAEIEAAFNRYAVLVFPDQNLTVDQHLDFARRFGPLETTIHALRKDAQLRLRPEIADVSNLFVGDKIWGENSRKRVFEMANRMWHTDSSFKRVPGKASLLYARSIVPVGGQTEYADMRAAYDALSDTLKERLRGLVAEHAIRYSRRKLGFSDFSDEENEALPPVPQVLVRRHPGSGRLSLYLASHAGRILGMDEAEGQALLQQLIDHATQRQFVYAHRWRVHDLVMWDNRCTMHRVRPYDDLRWPRDMQRTTVSDVAPTCEQEGIQVTAQGVPGRDGPYATNRA